MNTADGGQAYNSSDFLAKGVADADAATGDRSPGERTLEAIESRSVAADRGDEGQHGS
jgi:hypothetical protein